MERIFIQLVNMSLVAGWLILAVLLIRGIFNKLPKAFRCVMWDWWHYVLYVLGVLKVI